MGEEVAEERKRRRLEQEEAAKPDPPVESVPAAEEDGSSLPALERRLRALLHPQAAPKAKKLCCALTETENVPSLASLRARFRRLEEGTSDSSSSSSPTRSAH